MPTGDTTFPPPFDYQSKLLTEVRNGWTEYRKQLVVSPTGSGKAACFSWMAQEEAARGGRTLILVDQHELGQQALDKLKFFTGLTGELEQGKKRASMTAGVVVSLVQTMIGRHTRWPQDHFSLVVADEADKSLAPSWMACLNWFDTHARVCGFTATQFRADKRSLTEYYENIPVELKLVDLIRNGYLSPITIQMLPVKLDLSKVGIDKGDYSKDELDHAITPYLGQAVQALKQYASNRKTLVFLPLIRTSEKFVELCRAAGIAAEHIDGTSEDREEKLKRFKRREFSVLANSNLLVRGYDDPEIDCVFPLRPTQIIAFFQQLIGRGTRRYPGKKNLLILDLLYQAQRNMICRPAHLIAQTQEEADSMTTVSEDSTLPLDLLGLVVKGAELREQALRNRLAALAHRKAQFISADQFAAMHGNLAIAEFEPVMRWQFKPPTPDQIKQLTAANVDPDSVRGMAHAAMILFQLFKEKDSGPASRGQRYLMFKANWRSSDGKRGAWQATRRDAIEFFKQRDAKMKKLKQQPEFSL